MGGQSMVMGRLPALDKLRCPIYCFWAKGDVQSQWCFDSMCLEHGVETNIRNCNYVD